MAIPVQLQTVENRELKEHYLAYIQIFQAVLKKRPDPAEKKQSILKTLSTYLTENVHNVDEFINHIPQFAQQLGVNPDQLGAFVGANFIKALDLAKSQVASEDAGSSGKKTARSTSQKTYNSFIEEIVEKLDLDSPGRFVYVDQGLLKLLTPGGEVKSVSTEEGGPVADPSGNETGKSDSQAASAPTISGSTGTNGKTSGGKASASSPFTRETTIIIELLEKFGSTLDIHEKLVPSPFPADMIEQAQSEAENAASPPPAKAKVARDFIKEKSIIAELLEKFGSKLDIHEKLVIRDPVFEESNMMLSSDEEGSENSDLEDEDSYDEEENEPILDPIPVFYEEYTMLVKLVQSYQQKRDMTGYRQWYMQDADPGEKVVVDLKQWEAKRKKGVSFLWEDEYYDIGIHQGFGAEQVRDLHHRMKSYDGIQKLLHSLVGKIKQEENSVYLAIHKIWGQIKMLFHEDVRHDSLMSRLKIVLLQVTDSTIRDRIIELMDPVFVMAEELFHQEIDQ